MKRLLRSVVDIGDGSITQDQLSDNFQKLYATEIEWTRPEDQRIFDYLLGFFQQRTELPSLQTVRDYFEGIGTVGDIEAVERLKDIESASWYTRSNFQHLLRTLKEEQNRTKAVALLKEAHEIITKGVEVKEGNEKVRKQGLRDALIHFSAQAVELIQSESFSRTEGDIFSARDAKEAIEEYRAAAADQTKAWGKITGIEEIDDACHGLKPGELHVHAAFPSELKCLPGDAWVYDHSAGRRRSIEELYASGDLPVVTALQDEGRGSLSLVQASCSHVVQNGVMPVFELRLRSGRRVAATANHLFFTATGWKRLDTLTPRDWVAVPKHMSVTPPTRYTDEAVKLVGYLLGDGSLTHTVVLTASNPVIREDFKQCLLRMGLKEGFRDHQTPCFREDTPPDRAPFIEVGHNTGQFFGQESPVYTLLHDLKLIGVNSHTKFIPGPFYSLPSHQVRLLLGALWSTDGSCHHGEHPRTGCVSLCRRNDISYASVSLALCEGVQSLLLQLGIASTVTKVRTTYKEKPYTFYCTRVVTRPAKRKFLASVRVVGKEEAFAKLRVPDGDDSIVPSDLVPPGMKVPFGRSWRFSSQVKGRATLRRDTLELFAESPEVQRILQGDLAWDQVRDVTFRACEMTYDLSVPQHRSFVVNDIISHNTMLAANWAYNLAVRYQTNVVYFTLEMPYDQMRRNFYTIHSTNGIWSGVHAPLDYRKIRDGELSPDELQFYEAVCRDLDSPKYGQLKVIAPDRDMTIPDIRLKCEMINKETDAGVGFVVIDHGQLVTPVRHSKDYVIELNTIIRDAKKMALHFGNGRKIPVLMLFQINRHGKDDAAKNGGVYKASAIAYANECLAEGTLVRTRQGLLPIESVPVGSDVWSSTGWKTVKRTFANGVRPTVEVCTDQGFLVHCTKDHLFRVLSSDGTLEWVPAEKLRGRYVLADLECPSSGFVAPLPSLSFGPWEKPCGIRNAPLRVPVVLTTDLAYLIGAHDGDGVAGDEYRVGWTGNRKEVAVRERIRKSFKRCFGQNLSLSECPSRSGSFDLSRWSKALHRWFLQVGMNREAVVSSWVLTATPTLQMCYLQGLFDTDGSVNNQGVVSLRSAKRLLLEQVQLMLWGLGIPCALVPHSSTVRGKRYEGYSLRVVSQEGRRLFTKYIGFTEPHKRRRLKKLVDLRKTSRTYWPLRLLYLALYEEHKVVASKYKQLRYTASRLKAGTRLVPQGHLELLLRVIPSAHPLALQLVRLLRCRPQQVVSVKKGALQEVFDLEVSGDHEYSTGGLLTHNCEKSADVITTTYLDDTHRSAGTTLICNLKNRDNQQFAPFTASVEFGCRRIKSMTPFDQSPGAGMGLEDLI